MKRLLRVAIAGAVVLAFAPVRHVSADTWLNYYTTPFEYCWGTCNTPFCCLA